MSSDQRKDHVSNKEINIKSLEFEHLMSASLDSDASSDEECIFQDSSQKSDSFGSISKRILKKQECLEDALKRYNIAVKLETSLTETDSGKTDLEKLETYSELFKNNQEILKSSSNEAVQESLNGIQKILNKIGTVLACVAAAPLSLASYAARGTFKFWKSEKDLAKKAANKTIDGIEEKTSNLGFVSK